MLRRRRQIAQAKSSLPQSSLKNPYRHHNDKFPSYASSDDDDEEEEEVDEEILLQRQQQDEEEAE
jgi:hypothetical protein